MSPSLTPRHSYTARLLSAIGWAEKRRSKAVRTPVLSSAAFRRTPARRTRVADGAGSGACWTAPGRGRSPAALHVVQGDHRDRSRDAKRGELWRAYRQFHGQNGAPVLTWQAATRTMNPNISERVIAEAYERDPALAAAEYGAEFRSGVDTFVSREVAEACVELGVRERAPLSHVRYCALVDPSGGSSDSMTLAIADSEGERIVLDCIRERWAPFKPIEAVADFAAVLKAHRIHRVKGDRYGGSWSSEAFGKHDIAYEAAEQPKSRIYANLLPLLNSRRADLLDEPRLIAQLVGLERRTARGGGDRIDHAPGRRDGKRSPAGRAKATARRAADGQRRGAPA